jgi:hypothetical protein
VKLLGGMLWIFPPSGDPWWCERAEHYSRLIEHRQHDRTVHDLGFLFWSTWKRWYDLTGDPLINQVVVNAGKTLALRFKENGAYLRSFMAEDSLFIDHDGVGIIFCPFPDRAQLLGVATSLPDHNRRPLAAMAAPPEGILTWKRRSCGSRSGLAEQSTWAPA